MSFFADFRRGFSRGLRDDGAADPRRSGFEARPDHDEGSDGDEEERDLAECKALVEELLEENASLKAQLARGEGERAQASDQRMRAQMRELESILAFPGARKALLKALHPDTGEGGSKTSRTEITQTLNAVMERLGIRG